MLAVPYPEQGALLAPIWRPRSEVASAGAAAVAAVSTAGSPAFGLVRIDPSAAEFASGADGRGLAAQPGLLSCSGACLESKNLVCSEGQNWQSSMLD